MSEKSIPNLSRSFIREKRIKRRENFFSSIIRVITFQSLDRANELLHYFLEKKRQSVNFLRHPARRQPFQNVQHVFYPAYDVLDVIRILQAQQNHVHLRIREVKEWEEFFKKNRFSFFRSLCEPPRPVKRQNLDTERKGTCLGRDPIVGISFSTRSRRLSTRSRRLQRPEHRAKGSTRN